MKVPSGKNIVVANSPFGFVKRFLCPSTLSVGTLKLISFLKSCGNNVVFINMRSGDRFVWKKKRAGREGSVEVQTHLLGRPKTHFEESMDELPWAPDEFWFTHPFSCDHEVVESLIRTCRGRFPNVTIRAGGDFVFAAEPLSADLGVQYCHETLPQADNFRPDFSVIDVWDYGLFQLALGCPHDCTFCTSGLHQPTAIPVDGVIAYMTEFYAQHQPQVFWNWDPNALVFGKAFKQFLEKYIASDMTASLRFGKGFQPNLLTRELLDLMAEAPVSGASFPFEAGSADAMAALKKPYTIISSVKALDMANRRGITTDGCWCPFVFGYPEDDFAALFRVLLAVLKLGGNTTPFPVFLFPRTADYERYSHIIGDKTFSELHGQLWPLIPSSQVHQYQALFNFLDSQTIEQAQGQLDNLTPSQQDLFDIELNRSDRFVALCLDAKRDSIDELRRIEEAMDAPPQPLIPRDAAHKVLYIVANPKSTENSISKRLGRFFVDEYRSRNPRAEVVELDLYKEEIQFITDDFIQVLFDHQREPSPETQAQIEKIDGYIEHFFAADKIVMAMPMWTLSIPAILKAFLELVASRLFYGRHEKFTEKPVACVLTRDGSYKRDVVEFSRAPDQINVQERSIMAAMDFMGIGRDIHYICAENLYETTAEEKEVIVEATKEEIRECLQTF
ncbi:MAG: hypothetical protein HN348_00855 [Proteobacteria bacterium]|nr:hypothetical protein [Pseudomonadota bacterium]